MIAFSDAVVRYDQRISARAPQYLPTSTAIHCLGPDKIINTRDDIVSWR